MFSAECIGPEGTPAAARPLPTHLRTALIDRCWLPGRAKAATRTPPSRRAGHRRNLDPASARWSYRPVEMRSNHGLTCVTHQPVTRFVRSADNTVASLVEISSTMSIGGNTGGSGLGPRKTR